MRLPLAALLAVLLLVPLGLRAQGGAANLIADRLEITADGTLRAEGNVTAWYEGYRLDAAALTYDPATESLALTGPLRVTTPDGTILTAEAAVLGTGLREGLLTGARLVLDRQLQLAAARIARVDGRYNALDNAAVTSCQVCAGRAPLWEIRADRVLHDQDARQLYFDNARLLVRGVPVFWLPSMRLPDPTLDRAAGFLIPSLKTTDQLGFGVRVPYFLPIGPSRDLTVSPWVSPETRTLELGYRQALRAGDLRVEGAFGRDTIRPGDWRGYLMAEGEVDLGRDVVLGFALEAVSDRAYLYDYDFSDQDRLVSRLDVTQVRDASLIEGRVSYFETLRTDERNASLPPVVGFLDWDRRLTPEFGGTLTLSATADGFVRPETDPGLEGRDMARAGLAADWRGDAILGPGLLAQTALRLDLDAYVIGDDPAGDSPALRAVPQGMVTLRWPLTRPSGPGGRILLEPVAALGWTGLLGDGVPDEDSRLAEFDEANLLAFSRFPGQDAVEEGLRAALGLNWTALAPGGAEAGLTVGRIFRDRAAAFSETSGLSGLASDWLIAGHLGLAGGFRLDGRTLVSDALVFGQSEGRLDWSNEDLTLAAAYVYLPADPAVNRPLTASEWTFDGELRLGERWELRADARFDVARSEPARAGLGLGWRNECVTVDVSVSRRYTSSAFVDPSTSFGLTVNLNGFSVGRGARAVSGSCG